MLLPAGMRSLCIWLGPLIFVSFLCNGNGSADPLTGALRQFAYSIKETVQKFLCQLHLPRISQSPDGALSDQKGVPSDNPLFSPQRCPSCRPIPSQFLVGQWHISLFSRDFRLSVLTDLDSMIDRLEAGLPIRSRKSFADLVTDPPDPFCPLFTVLDFVEESAKCEIFYHSPGGKVKSVVGFWERVPSDGSFVWRIGQIAVAQFCVVHFASELNILSLLPSLNSTSANVSASLNMNGTNVSSSSASSSSSSFSSSSSSMSVSSSSSAFVLLNQIDSWPRCDNFVALSRNLGQESVDGLKQWVEGQRRLLRPESALNAMEKAKCDGLARI